MRTITPTQHLDYLRSLPSSSFLQTPAWGRVKTEWRSESIGFFAGSDLVGAGLVLYRQLPKVKRFLAYLPEGPVVDWYAAELPELLNAMARHLKSKGAFGIRIGPPVVVRRWDAATVKSAIADPAIVRLGQVRPSADEPRSAAVRDVLHGAGWVEQETDASFAVGQPKYVFQLPLAGRRDDDIVGRMSQQWRRNIKKAAKSGVVVRQGGVDELPAFHRLYVETATRDQFTPRPLAYFATMFDVLLDEDPDRIRLYLAHHEGDLVAAATWVRVGRHTWYSYGASSTDKRDVRGSNAIQWQLIRDAIAIGADVYDLRGITDTVAHDDPHLGLIQFKVGTGGEAVELLGEWDLPLNRLVYKAFAAYMKRR